MPAASSSKSRDARRGADPQLRQDDCRAVPAGESMNLRDYLLQQQRTVDTELDRLVLRRRPPGDDPSRDALQPFAGGKRIRPILCIEAARTVTDDCPGAGGGLFAGADPHLFADSRRPAALDNDDYRRGKLTITKSSAMRWRFWRAIRCSRWHFVLAQLDAPDARKDAPDRGTRHRQRHRRRHDRRQVADLERGKPPDAQLLETIHRAKTGALLRACVWGDLCGRR